MKMSACFKGFATVTLALMVVSGVAMASEQINPTTPGFRVESNQVSWGLATLKGDYVLSVSCPDGTIVKQQFNRGVNPKFNVVGRDGKVLPDGLYRYEVKVVPQVDAETMEVLRIARETDDADAIEKLRAENRLQSSGIVTSGSFSIAKGAFVAPDKEEVADYAKASGKFDLKIMDVLHYDDVIITGSLCVGFDCVNGESFGYDTVKLKENNLRLYFEDTSAGSFPTGDWRIRINDTTSGGASYFAIEDGTNGRTPFRIETGAPTHSLYVEDYGRVGLGTSIPYVELHIVDGDTPTVRLDQDGSSGWTAQSWDLAGNETNFFIRDVTNGSKLCLRIQPNTPSSTLNLKSTGYVGVGTWSPAAPLHVSVATPGAGNSMLILERLGDLSFQLKNSTNSDFWQISNSGANDKLNFSRSGTGGVEMEVDSDGTLTVRTAIKVGSTTLNVPDFVLAPNYELMPLGELRSFVKDKGHLPNVPSAAEVQRSGLNMTEMQLRLLEKVEELTLYTFAQQERIEQLEAQLADLSK